MLSNFKNNISPRYHSKSITFEQNKNTTPTLSCKINIYLDNVNEKEFGKSMQSKFKNVCVRTFSKAKRNGLADKTKLFVPGFKYAVYSEFSNPMKSPMKQ